MMGQGSRKKQSRTALADNPLDGEQLLLDTLFGERAHKDLPAPRPATRPSPQKPKPSHYKVVSISLYNEDIDRLERMVTELKRRGHHKANKSQLIRQALAQIDLDAVAREA